MKILTAMLIFTVATLAAQAVSAGECQRLKELQVMEGSTILGKSDNRVVDVLTLEETECAGWVKVIEAREAKRQAIPGDVEGFLKQRFDTNDVYQDGLLMPQFLHIYAAGPLAREGATLKLSYDQSFGARVAYNTYGKQFGSRYVPTNREVLDILAWWTDGSWTFDKTKKAFHFSPAPNKALPFSVDVPAGWVQEKNENYVKHAPKDLCCGIDIYYFGHHTNPSEGNQAEFEKETRNHYATFMWKLYRAPKIPSAEKDMKEIQVNGQTALFWEQPSGWHKNMPRLWRQWVMMIDGHVYLLVSSVEEKNKSRIFPEVDKLLASFKATTSGPFLR